MSALFGARAPELMPEIVQDLNIQPANTHKHPLHERSLSDLNKKLQPTIRLIDSEQDLKQRPFSGSNAEKRRSRRQKESIFIDVPAANARPASRDGAHSAQGTRSFLSAKLKRASVSTTASNAETLVADSLFSPVSRRFSIESQSKSQYTVEPQGIAIHMETLQELSSDMPGMDADNTPDIPELPSSVNRIRKQLAHSSSVYSNSPFDAPNTTPFRTRPRSSSSGLGFCVSPYSEDGDIERALEVRPPQMSDDSVDESASGSTPHLIRYINSQESLKPQYVSIRPANLQSSSTSSSWSAQSIGEQQLAPLHISRKRGHMKTTSLTTYPSITRLAAKHLSTIPSEAEGPTSAAMRQSAPANAPAAKSYRRRTVTSSSYSELSSQKDDRIAQQTSSSYDSVSSGIHSVSAIPEPLFSSSAPLPQKPFVRDSTHVNTSELDDTIGELPPLKTLREQRSGYFARKRSQAELRPSSRQSNHTPGESERWSTGTSIFPQWAKAFYAGRAQILSAKPSMATLRDKASKATLRDKASKATLRDQVGSPNASKMTIAGPPYSLIGLTATAQSLDLPRPGSRNTQRHSRADTLATFSSFHTRPGSGHSAWETVYDESPAPRFTRSALSQRVAHRRAQTEGSAYSVARDSISIHSPERDAEGEFNDQPSAVPSKSTLFSRVASLRHPLRQNPATTTTPTAAGALPPPSRAGTVRTTRTMSTLHSPTSRAAPHRSSAHHQPPPPVPAHATTLSTFHNHSFASFPHLLPTRRGMVAGRSLTTAWRVPSFDEPLPAELLGRGNRQIVCFCLGFIFPPMWMLASVLSLPRCGWREDEVREAAAAVREKGKGKGYADSVLGEHGVGAADGGGVEIRVKESWDWEDERSFLKARWWRTLNRVMSVIGVGILAAIITLAVLASRG